MLAEFPFGKDNDVAYMYFSTRHWGRLLNGYSGFSPKSYVELRQRVASFPHPRPSISSAPPAPRT